MPHVVQILIAESTTAPMGAVAEARLVPGRGIEGDRYFHGQGTFSPAVQEPEHELTLIEREQIEAFARESGLAFTAAHARRNVVTEGVDLNALVGKEFMIGQARVRGTGLCEPCTYLAKISFPETLEGLVHKGGLRAQILSEAVVRAGDTIIV